MKIKVETLEELLGEIETEERFEIILPFLKKISELEEKNEALEGKNKELGQFEGTDLINKELRRENSNLLENLHNLESKIDLLKDENEILGENYKGIQNKISKLRNIFKSIEKGISIETLYEKIKEIGDLIDSDLSEQIELIKTINEGFREGQNEIRTLRWDKERIEIQWVQLQKENEKLKEEINKLEDTNRKLSGELLNQNEEIHLLEEEIDRLKSANPERNEVLKERINDLEDKNRKLSGELIHQTHMLEEEVDRLRNENEDLKRLNRQIQENVK